MKIFWLKIKRAIKNISRMGTYKEDYEIVKENTIKKFYEHFNHFIEQINTQPANFPKHDLKGVFTDLNLDEDLCVITLKLCNRKIVFEYDIFPRDKEQTAKIKLFKAVLSYEDYPNYKLVTLSELDITFGDKRDNYYITFKGLNYENKGDNFLTEKTQGEYFEEWLLLLVDTVFSEKNIKKTY